MQTSNNDSASMIVEFLAAIEQQTEAALFIAKESGGSVGDAAAARGFVMTSRWKEALSALNEGRKVCLNAGTISKEVYDLVRQYNDRQGMVQILDSETLELCSVHLAVESCRLLVLTTEPAMNESKFPLLSQAGLIGRE